MSDIAEEWIVLRMKVRDRAQAIRDLRATAAEVKLLGASTESAGLAMRRAGRHGFFWHQAMFTLRRTVYGLTLGVASLGTAVVATGIQFDAMMETQQLALARFAGGAAGARKETEFLFDLAAKTPFEFQDVIQATRLFVGFGYTIKQSNALLTDLGDAIAGIGGGAPEIQRAALALGQMRATGRLLGQDVRQLQQLGLFNPEDFARRLGLSSQEVAGNIGSLGIPTKVGIDAITAYWRSRFGGSARAFQHTWTGEISTIKDYGRRAFGAIAQPLFDKLEKDVLPVVQKITLNAEQGFKERGIKGFFQAIDTGVGHNLNLAGTYVRLAQVTRAWWSVIKPLYIDLFWAYHVLDPALSGALTLVLGLVAALSWAIRHLGFVLKPLIALWLVERTVTLALALASKTLLLWDVLLTYWTNRKKIALIGATIWGWRNVAALQAQAFATEEVWVADLGLYRTQLVMTGLSGRFLRHVFSAAKAMKAYAGATIFASIAQWEFDAAVLANPYVLLAVGLIAITTTLVVLYFEWKKFHDLVNSTFNFVSSHWTVFQFLVPMGFAITTVYNGLKNIYDLIVAIFKAVANPLSLKLDLKVGSKALGLFKWLTFGNPLSLGGATNTILKFAHLPHLASGGMIDRSGLSLVGERGPELVNLPQGASVLPFDQLSRGVNLPRELLIKVPVMIDAKEVALAVARVNLDNYARA